MLLNLKMRYQKLTKWKNLQNKSLKPFLSKYNLYPNVNFNKNKNKNRKSYILNLILKILSLSNGKHDLFDLSNIIGISIFEIISNNINIYLK